MLAFLSKTLPTRSNNSLPWIQRLQPTPTQPENNILLLTQTNPPPSLFTSFKWQSGFFVAAADPNLAYIKQRIIVSTAIPTSEHEIVQHQVALFIQRTQELSRYHKRYIDLVLASPGFTITIFADAEAYTANSPTGLKGFYMPAVNMLGINQDYLKYESENINFVSGYLLAEEFFHALVCLSNTNYDPISASKNDLNLPITSAIPYQTLEERNKLNEIFKKSFEIAKDYKRLLETDENRLTEQELARLEEYQKAIENYVPRIRTIAIASITDLEKRQEALRQLANRTYQGNNYIITKTNQKVYYCDQAEIANIVLARGYLVEDPAKNKAQAFIEDMLFDNVSKMVSYQHVTANENWLIETHASISTNHPRILRMFYPGLIEYNSKIINKVQFKSEETIDMIQEDFHFSHY